MSFPRGTPKILLLLVLAGCDHSPDPTGPAAAPLITPGDGDGQTGRLGEPLPQPFVVHVGNGASDLRDFAVTWTVTSGQGSFVGNSVTRTDDFGNTSIRFVPSTHRATVRASAPNATGWAEFKVLPEPKAIYTTSQTAGTPCGEWCWRYTFFPDQTFDLGYLAGGAFSGTWTKQGDVLLLQFDGNSGWQARATIRGTQLDVRYNSGMDLSDFEDAVFELVRSGPVPDWLPAQFAAIAGDGQSGPPGHFLSSPLTVRVTDFLGGALSNVVVEWEIISGGGELSWWPDIVTPLNSTPTDGSGTTRVYFRPLLPGGTVVEATVRTLPVSPVRFRIDVDPSAAPWVIVSVGPHSACTDLDTWPCDKVEGPSEFSGIPDGPVPVGTTLEFMACCAATEVDAHVIPPGGTAFHSGKISPGHRFAAVLDAVGTWTFQDGIFGGQASVTVIPRP